MIKIAAGIFLVLHGLVHMLYFGHSQRYFELQTGLTWPDGAWAFSRLLDDSAIRALASAALVIAAIGFVVAGVGVFVEQGWWRPITVGATVFSSIMYALFWNGKWQHLDDQGWVGILINGAILVAVLVAKWPDFDF